MKGETTATNFVSPNVFRTGKAGMASVELNLRYADLVLGFAASFLDSKSVFLTAKDILFGGFLRRETIE